MFDTLKNLLGIQPKADLSALIKDGAVILDVRTPGEFSQGHVKGSVNMPLDQLQTKLSKLDKNKPVITCCASGMRSSVAKGILKKAGFTTVHNGGSWTKVSGLLNN